LTSASSKSAATFVSNGRSISIRIFSNHYTNQKELYLLTIPFTFQFYLHNAANPTINLIINPRANITIESVTHVFQTLANQTGHSNVGNGLDEEVNNWARWAQMNPTLCGNKETTERLKKAFATTTNYQKQKLATIMCFFAILAAHPEARVCALSNTINDPEMDRNTFCFFTLAWGKISCETLRYQQRFDNLCHQSYHDQQER